jgi:hypothetical protein
MPAAYVNRDGQLVKRCTNCQQIKPATLENFNLNDRKSNRLKSWCRVCDMPRKRLLESEVRSKGILIKELFIRSRGSKCEYHGCHMRYPDDLPGNFDLDHIDPKKKQHQRETSHDWIARHEKEFWQRVAPNLRLLCCHHHRVVTGDQHTFGGDLHQIRFGTADPSHFFNIPQDHQLVLFEWKASGGAACPTL